MPRERHNVVRVGALVLAAIAVLAIGIFLIGEKNNLFSRKNRYFARFETVSGLGEGSYVQLNGVRVGRVQDIVLPQDPGESLIKVEFSLDRRYAERLRGDSTAQIKTLGLLGDKYLEVTSGSLDSPVIANRSEVPAAKPTSVDALVASGEDVMANVTAISASLKVILGRMEKGQGLLGELVADTETGDKVSDRLIKTLESVQRVAERVEHGEGALPRLISDAALADKLASSVDRLDAALLRFEQGQGLVPALLDDAKTKQDFDETLASLKTTAANLSKFSTELQDANGLLPRLLFDEPYGEQMSHQLESTVARFDRLATELETGDGTAARLIHDPEIYEALQDIIVGVNESRMLRWLIRNRQKAGIEKRYEETPGAPPGGPPGD
jgi:phospholipid/cholesterol/gamma-HCH transport system substrate-binding protein